MPSPNLLIAISAVAGIAVCFTLLPTVLRSVRFDGPIIRNIVHTCAFLMCALGIYYLTNRLVLIATASFAILALILVVEFLELPGVLHGVRARDYGLVMSAVGILVVGSLFFQSKEIVVVSLLVVGLADPASAIFGRRFGRRQITAWGARRSLEGSAAFASVTFLLSIAYFARAGGIGVPAVVCSLYLAFTTALVELIVPSALDNVAIPVWVASLLFLFGHENENRSLELAGGILIALAFAPLCYRLQWLDTPGSVAAAFVVAITVAFGGLPWIVPLLVFFASGSVLTRFRQTKAIQLRRGLQQVLANGLLPVLPVMGYAIDRGVYWYFVYVGAVVVANADTWATEIGRWSTNDPVSLRSLRRVSTGTSGAISGLGTVASIAGGVVIGAAAAAVAPAEWRIGLLLTGALIGPLGAAIDSVLGAWVQGQFVCPICGTLGDTADHCKTGGRVVQGLPAVTNNVVNVAANVSGMVLAYLGCLLFR
jgi:uncharacterized protein (TIGR00297 family)